MARSTTGPTARCRPPATCRGERSGRGPGAHRRISVPRIAVSITPPRTQPAHIVRCGAPARAPCDFPHPHPLRARASLRGCSRVYIEPPSSRLLHRRPLPRFDSCGGRRRAVEHTPRPARRELALSVWSFLGRQGISVIAQAKMALERSFVDSMASQNPCGVHKSSLENWKSLVAAAADSEDNLSGGFECNICLDIVQDPVVTLCGHLYCWPCIYKWLQVQSTDMENEEPQPQQCPVCKAEVSQATLVPLYGRGGSTKSAKSKARQLGLVIPKRPFGPACGVDSPRSLGSISSPRSVQRVHNQVYTPQSPLYQSQLGTYPAAPMTNLGGASTNSVDPMIGMLGEMVYARVFGNSMTNLYSYPNSYHLAGSSSPRIRLQLMPGLGPDGGTTEPFGSIAVSPLKPIGISGKLQLPETGTGT
ncbi:hypothetical protein NL676_017468 [Syzygium grande]|nr:hypothetical protein NL676_017468 [Syzygium grande]